MRYAWAGFLLFLAGCASSTEQARSFPSTWPGSSPLNENAPTVSVAPMKVDVPLSEMATQTGEGVPTPAVLTALFIKHLHAAGVNAVLEQAQNATAPYAMQCAVSRLGYAQRAGFPEQFTYEAALICTLVDIQAQRVVWKRSLQQRYETSTLVNTFAKVPEQPHQHDRVLYKECIVPLWDAMASSVRTALISRPPAPPSAAPQPAASTPAPNASPAPASSPSATLETSTAKAEASPPAAVPKAN